MKTAIQNTGSVQWMAERWTSRRKPTIGSPQVSTVGAGSTVRPVIWKYEKRPDQSFPSLLEFVRVSRLRSGGRRQLRAGLSPAIAWEPWHPCHRPRCGTTGSIPDRSHEVGARCVGPWVGLSTGQALLNPHEWRECGWARPIRVLTASCQLWAI